MDKNKGENDMKKLAKKEKTVRPHKVNAESKGLKVNAIVCPKCGDTLYSRARHDYRNCTCGEVVVDGGFDYLRVAYKKKDPKRVEVWVDASIKDLYRDWNLSEDKYGLIRGSGV